MTDLDLTKPTIDLIRDYGAACQRSSASQGSSDHQAPAEALLAEIVRRLSSFHSSAVIVAAGEHEDYGLLAVFGRREDAALFAGWHNATHVAAIARGQHHAYVDGEVPYYAPGYQPDWTALPGAQPTTPVDSDAPTA